MRILTDPDAYEAHVRELEKLPPLAPIAKRKQPIDPDDGDLTGLEPTNPK